MLTGRGRAFLATTLAGFQCLNNGCVVTVHLVAFEIFRVYSIRELIRTVFGIGPAGA